jgi:hypothetical protein
MRTGKWKEERSNQNQNGIVETIVEEPGTAWGRVSSSVLKMYT